MKQIKELMVAMKREGIKKLSIKEKTGYEIHLEREGEVSYQISQPHPVIPVHHHHQPMPHKEVAAGKTEEKEGRFVTSPMVGTFYAGPSPDDPHFVKVGDRVEEGSVLCIIEAMKVMNEVKAGMSGTVAEVLVESAHPVEFGTKMFRIV